MTTQPLVQSVHGKLLGLIFQIFGYTKNLTCLMVYDYLSYDSAERNSSYLAEQFHIQDLLVVL